MGFRVRDAAPSDLERLVDYALAEAADSEGAEKDRERVRRGVGMGLEHPDVARYWVLEDDAGEVIGSTSVVREWSDWNAGDYWWVQSMYLEPWYRGRELMGLLLDEVRRAAGEAHALELRLYVHRDNTPALHAYRRFGFLESEYRIMHLPQA